MTSDDTYQGWANRETWAASLHLGNDFAMYDMAGAVIRAAREDAGDDAGPWTDANALEDWFTEMRDEWCEDPNQVREEVAMMMREVGSWWRVDWRAVAEGLVDSGAVDS